MRRALRIARPGKYWQGAESHSALTLSAPLDGDARRCGSPPQKLSAAERLRSPSRARPAPRASPHAAGTAP
jgi:hypothetical protein